eukprot:8260483-Pyramimonas_sp.AAC.1
MAMDWMPDKRLTKSECNPHHQLSVLVTPSTGVPETLWQLATETRANSTTRRMAHCVWVAAIPLSGT